MIICLVYCCTIPSLAIYFIAQICVFEKVIVMLKSGELWYPDSVESVQVDMCPSVGLGNILKILHVFLPKISVGVSIPMTECLVSGTGTRGNMKSRGNVGDEAVWRIAVFLAKHEK